MMSPSPSKEPFVSAAFERAYGAVLAHLVELSRRRGWFVIAVAAIATVLCGFYAANHMGIETDPNKLLSPDLPYRKTFLDFSRSFPMLGDNLVIVIDGGTADQTEDAAAALVARFKKRTDLFDNVFAPTVDPFFRTNGLLFLDPPELQDLSDQLASAEPFIAALGQDMSLRGLFQVMGLAADAVVSGDADPQSLKRIFGALNETITARLDGKPETLSWRALLSPKPLSPSEKRQIIVVTPKLSFKSLSPADEAIAESRKAGTELGLGAPGTPQLLITGGAALDNDEMQSVMDGVGLASVISLVLVTFVVFVGLRSPRLVVAAVATLLMSLVWTAGFAAIAVGHLNLISVAFAVLFIGLAVDFSIQFGLRYREGVDAGHSQADSLREAAVGTGAAIGLAALCAAIGFFSFVPTAYIGLSELGIIAGGSMFIGLFATLTILPAFLAILPVRPNPLAAGHIVGPVRFGQFSERHAGKICLGALALGLSSLLFLPSARFDFDPIHLKDQNTESVRAYLDLTQNSESSPYSINIVEPDLAAADALAQQLDKLPEVAGTATLTSFIPKDQEAKLAIIDNMSIFLGPVLRPAPSTPPETAAERKNAIDVFHAKLDALAASPKAGDLASSAHQFSALLSRLPANADDHAYQDFETALVANLPARLDGLRQSLKAGPVTIKDLPADIKQRYVTPDGHARIEVYPKENLEQQQPLIRFVKAVREIAPDATDTPVVLLEGGNTVIDAFKEAGAIAFVAITILLLIVLRSVIETLFVLLPLVLASALTAAIAVLLDIPFNFANVIAMPLLFSLGVAFGLYLVMRYRETGSVADLMHSSTPRAVVFSALTTMVSFGSLMISSHRGTASMGQLLALCLTLALMCTVIVLPALLAWRARRKF